MSSPSSSRDGSDANEPPSVHSLPKLDTKTPAAAAVSPSPRGQQQQQQQQQQQRRRRQSRPGVPGIVTTPVVEPSHDPSTGLDIFPRLPEPPSPPHEPSPTTAPTTAAADAVSTPSPSTLKACLANLFTSLSPSANTTNTTTAAAGGGGGGAGTIPSSPSSPLAHAHAHTSRAESASPAPERCGSHIYCRHTWDEDCKCVAVLELRGGAREYCRDCWHGKCRGATPAQPHLDAAAASSHSSPPAGPAETSLRESLDRDARGANKKGSWGIDLWGARPGSRPTTPKA